MTPRGAGPGRPCRAAPGRIRGQVIAWQTGSRKKAGDGIADVPLYRRTLSWVMQKKVHVAMLPDDTIPVRWAYIR